MIQYYYDHDSHKYLIFRSVEGKNNHSDYSGARYETGGNLGSHPGYHVNNRLLTLSDILTHYTDITHYDRSKEFIKDYLLQLVEE